MREIRYYNFYEGDYIYEIDWRREVEVVEEILKEESGLDKEEAQKVASLFLEYGLIDKVIEDNMDFVRQYFEQEAYEQFKD